TSLSPCPPLSPTSSVLLSHCGKDYTHCGEGRLGRDRLFATRELGPQLIHEHRPLAMGQVAETLVLAGQWGGEKLAGAGPAPAPLARQQLGDRHRFRLGRRFLDDVGGFSLAAADLSLQARSGSPALI